jgi:hypothetical protein
LIPSTLSHQQQGGGRNRYHHSNNRQFRPHQNNNNNFQRWNFNQFQPDFREFPSHYQQPSGDYYFQPFPTPSFSYSSLPSTSPLLQSSHSPSLIPLSLSCPQVKFYNRTDDKLFGKIDLTILSDIVSVEIEIEFDEFIPIFAVEYHQSSHYLN